MQISSNPVKSDPERSFLMIKIFFFILRKHATEAESSLIKENLFFFFIIIKPEFVPLEKRFWFQVKTVNNTRSRKSQVDLKSNVTSRHLLNHLAKWALSEAELQGLLTELTPTTYFQVESVFCLLSYNSKCTEWVWNECQENNEVYHGSRNENFSVAVSDFSKVSFLKRTLIPPDKRMYKVSTFCWRREGILAQGERRKLEYKEQVHFTPS